MLDANVLKKPPCSRQSEPTTKLDQACGLHPNPDLLLLDLFIYIIVCRKKMCDGPLLTRGGMHPMVREWQGRC